MVALRLFHRVEVFALHVFDDGDLERVRIAGVDRDDRYFVQAGDLRRAPAAFAGDDFVTILYAAHRPYHDRLDHAMLLDRIGEFAKFSIGERAARIARIGFEEFDRHLALRARPLDVCGLAT